MPPTPPALIIDARAWFGSGIGRVMRAVTARLVSESAFGEVALAGDAAELRPWVDSHAPAARVVPIRAPRYSWRTEREWRRIAPQLPTDAVVWFPHWDVPFTGQRWANVVTVHDLIPLLVPGSAGALRRAGMRWWLRRALQGATRVATPSETTAALLQQRFNTNAPRVIHNGADLDAETAAPGLGAAQTDPRTQDTAAPLVPTALPYLLVVANRKPHKALDVALRAFAKLRAEWPELQLVVCGERFAYWGALQQLAQELGISGAVHDPGVVTDDALVALYRNAECLLAPARMEGFGLPVVEAMRCGCPVVASDIGAHREVAGDAALLVPVGNAAATADAVRRLRDDKQLRAQCVARGVENGSRFTWARAASALSALLLEAYGMRTGSSRAV